MNASPPVSPAGGAAVAVRPIGVVESPFRTVDDRCDYAAEACVRVRPELEPGLAGLEYFSHLWVIYHQHRAQAWLHARGWAETGPLVLPADDDRAGQGVFSSRAPCRPAALGSCIVELVRREGPRLLVRGLDAIDGTPVLDLKPYVPQFDAFPGATVPLHWAKVMARDDDPSHGSRRFHWDTTNADFALGLRAGLAALERLGAARGDHLRAEIHGSLFLAQGLEMATGCSPLRGSLAVTELGPRKLPWRVRVSGGQGAGCEFELATVRWPDAAAVFSAREDQLLTTPAPRAGAFPASLPDSDSHEQRR